MVERFLTLSRRLSLAGAALSALLVIALVVLITVEIVGRSFFDYSTMLADEYSGYFYLASIYFGLAYTFQEGGHIRIRIVTDRLGRKAKRWADILSGILLLAMLLFALVYSWRFMYESYEMEMVSEGVSETPLYLTQIPIVVGLALFIIAVMAFLVERIRHDQ